MRQDISQLPISVQQRIEELKKIQKKKSVVIFRATEKFVENATARKNFERYVRYVKRAEKNAARANFTYL